jgi:hypothetical protein
MRIRQVLSWVVLVIGMVGGCSRNPESAREGTVPPEGPVELTKYDIMAAVVPPNRLRVLGIALGDTVEQTETLLRATQRYNARVDNFNPTRRYVYDGTLAASDSVLYLLWRPEDPKLARIVVYPLFQDRLVGETKALLGIDALDPGSNVGRLLGPPTDQAVTLEVPSISLKITSSFYRGRGLVVLHVTDSQHDRMGFEIIREDIDFKSK